MSQNNSADNANKRLSLLLVDDSKINLLIIENHLKLKNEKLEITTVHEGKKALELCKEKKYDLILLDIHMPEISGIEVADNIRNNCDKNANTPIIALTADISDSTLEQCEKVKINQVMSKPFEMDELLKEIEHILKNEE